MQQLRVYPNDQALKEDAIMIDLYEQDPIKLTLSVEDITNAEASSVFSKTFRVPATGNNNQFFKHAFLINGVDYDVTIKKPAEVLVDGSEFRRGHIRLQKIFINGLQDKIEYEILFLGETRDFSSKIGDKGMCELQILDLLHGLTKENVIASWQAFPQGAFNDGLFNGDVLYPLIDHGNTYIDGIAQESRISMIDTNRFTQNSHPISAGRFKPMIRAKRLFDQIFFDSGYTYESTFLGSDLFRRLYVSAFGNDASVSIDVTTSSVNNFEVEATTNTQIDNPIPFETEISDPSNNFDLATNTYFAPISGAYTFSAYAYVNAVKEISSPGSVQYTNVPAYLELAINNGATVIATGGEQNTPNLLTLNVTVNLNAGDGVRLYANSNFGYDFISIDERGFSCTASPGLFNPTNSLDCEYKQIDFIKDILTMFRLVMSPDPLVPNRFLIEPYVDYIYTGETYDWSNKLVRDKDVEIEPLFNTQSDRIEFKFAQDGDYINKYHQDAYKNPYGYLAFDSGNDLLKGTRNINVNIAPTPVARIEGAPVTSSWIIPHIHTHEAGDEGTEHLPIKAKTRLLFYNGLLATDIPWYMIGEPVPFSTYPAATPYETFPQTQSGLNLNWFNDVKYWGPDVVNYQVDGITLFQRFWSSYITDLYNKFARRLTATFILNNVDLQNFSFNDIVFVDGVYYRPEKILDAPIGQRAPVKVQLIKAIDYRPLAFDQPLIFTAQSFNGCHGQDDKFVNIQITNGLPPYQYEISNGDSGFFATYEASLGPIAPGTYNITITEAAGFSDTKSFTITDPAILTATQNVDEESPCGANNGAIEVYPTGGTAPYTIAWDNGTSEFTLTNLAAGEYEYTIYDANGCQYYFNVDVPCSGAPTLQVFAQSTDPSSCGAADGTINLTISGGVPPYDVQWSDLPGFPTSLEDRTDLDEGTYTYTVTDSATPTPNQVGPNNITLNCTSGAAFEQALTVGNSDTEACGLNAPNTYWSNTQPIEMGTLIYATLIGAQTEDDSALVSSAWYSDGTAAFFVINGEVIDIIPCSIEPIPLSCHTLYNDQPLQGDVLFTYVNSDGNPDSILVSTQEIICAEIGTVQADTGGSFVNENTLCSSDANCI